MARNVDDLRVIWAKQVQLNGVKYIEYALRMRRLYNALQLLSFTLSFAIKGSLTTYFFDLDTIDYTAYTIANICLSTGMDFISGLLWWFEPNQTDAGHRKTGIALLKLHKHILLSNDDMHDLLKIYETILDTAPSLRMCENDLIRPRKSPGNAMSSSSESSSESSLSNDYAPITWKTDPNMSIDEINQCIDRELFRKKVIAQDTSYGNESNA